MLAGSGVLLGVRVHEWLHTTQGLVREGVVQDTALTSVVLDVGDVPGVEDVDIVSERAVVGLGLNDISLIAKDRLVGIWRVHDHGIWAVAEDRA